MAGSAVTHGLKLGELAWLYDLPNVSDIAVTCDGTVWVDCGHGMECVTQSPIFAESGQLREYAVSLCAQLGVRLDDASPIADAASVDGVRLHAVIQPVVPFGASISIRIPQWGNPTLTDLQRAGMIPHAWLGALQRCVDWRANVLITGATGAGKTTLLKAMLAHCPTQERIISIEEVREIVLPHHLGHVPLVAKQANIEGAGAVTLSQLVSAVLRMRPDRIVLGECRGEEIADVLRVFSAGHRGSFVTLHADSVERVPQRLLALGALAGLHTAAINAMVRGAFDVILHVQKTAYGRKLLQVGVFDDTVESMRVRVIAQQ